MTTDAIRTAAADAGFTRYVEAEAGAVDLQLWVRPHTDLDEAFEAICAETGDRLNVRGWNLIIHTLEAAA